MIDGLHRQIWQLRQQAERDDLRARAPHTDPHTAYDCEQAVIRGRRAADRMAEQAHENAELIEAVLPLIKALRASPHQSDHRTLALRHLEDAYLRLLLENGKEVA